MTRRMNIRLHVTLAVLPAVSIGGCDFPPLCTDENRPAVIVEVRNVRTGDPEADGVDGVLIEEGYADSLIVWQQADGVPLTLAGGFERAGTYTIEINKSGFATWRREGVRVEEGECGPKTHRLTARIEAAD